MLSNNVSVCINYYLLTVAACIDKKYGLGTMVQNEAIIKKKCNQKCIDVANKRVKKLKQEKENNNPSEN